MRFMTEYTITTPTTLVGLNLALPFTHKSGGLTSCWYRLTAHLPHEGRVTHLRNATEITSPTGLPYRPSSVLRQQLHSLAMRLLSRLEYERSCSASSGSYFLRIP